MRFLNLIIGFLLGLINDSKKVVGNEVGAWWIPVAMAAGQMIQQNEENEQIRAQNKAAATQTEFSPYTGQGAGQIQSQGSMIGAGIKGAASGMAMGQSYDNWQNARKMQNQNMQQQPMNNNMTTPAYKQMMVNGAQNQDPYAVNWQSMKGRTGGAGYYA